jgi:hypothetical protein
MLLDRLGQFGIFEVEAIKGVGHWCLSVVMFTVL